jgi:hypothetical protein
MEERSPCKRGVVGSIPTLGSALVAHLVERVLGKDEGCVQIASGAFMSTTHLRLDTVLYSDSRAMGWVKDGQ